MCRAGVSLTHMFQEWRFIVYVMPILNILAGSTASALWYIPHRAGRVVTRLGVLALLAITLAVTAFSTYVSTANYPGGQVWTTLNTLAIPEGSTIHFPSYPLQTGATLFTFTHASATASGTSGALAFPAQQSPTWVYSKNEDVALLTPAGAWAADIDYVITHNAASWISGHKAYRNGELMWTEVANIGGLNGVRRGGKYFLEVAWGKKLSILKRVD